LDRVGHERPLVDALSEALKAVRAIAVPVALWRESELPQHLIMNFSVVDESGAEIGSGRNLIELQHAHGGEAQASFAAQSQWERAGIRTWDTLELPEKVTLTQARQRLEGYPALIDEGDSVRVALLETADNAQRETRRGVTRLARIALKDQVRALER